MCRYAWVGVRYHGSFLGYSSLHLSMPAKPMVLVVLSS